MDSEEYEWIVDRCKRAKVLLIDDLFKGRKLNYSVYG